LLRSAQLAKTVFENHMVLTLRFTLNYRSWLFLHLSEWRFRHASTNSNKYSRKLISIGSFLCIPANFYFVTGLTWMVKVKNKHISVGLSNCRTIELSDYRTDGLSGCQTIELTYYRTDGLSGCRTVGLTGCRIIANDSYAPEKASRQPR
jgi:hypothetical protein